MPTSHCLPNGQLGTNELPVPNISGATITVFNPSGGVGTRRGVVVYMHGLYTSAQQFPVPPGVIDSYSTGIAALMPNSHCLNLAALGYVVLAVTAQEDTYAGNPMIGVYNDAASSTNGARYLASTLHTWDHVYQYIQQTYGYNSGTSTAWATSGGVPIFLTGFSIGSWRSLQILQNRTGMSPKRLLGTPTKLPLVPFAARAGPVGLSRFMSSLPFVRYALRIHQSPSASFASCICAIGVCS